MIDDEDEGLEVVQKERKKNKRKRKRKVVV